MLIIIRLYSSNALHGLFTYKPIRNLEMFVSQCEFCTAQEQQVEEHTGL